MDHELLASHVDAIYGVAREDFTAERDGRTSDLRADGRRDEAAALKAHRKPTVPAWAVNQLARRATSPLEALIATGEELRDAQRRATSGAGSTGLRETTRRVRDLVADLSDVAREVIEASGSRPDAHLDEVAQTLFAGAVDPAHHETLRRGVFATPLQPTGFGAMDALAPDAAAGAVPASPARRKPDTATRARPRAKATAATRRREARRRELEQHSRDVQRSRDRQQRRAERAATKADELRARAADAAADADEQQAELARLERELEAARHELDELATEGR